MNDNKTIQCIVSSGGWCDIYPKANQAIADKSFGRILHNGIDYLVVQRFAIAGEYPDGFYSIPKSPFLQLQKAFWLKRYLAVGGKVIEDAELPEVLIGENWVITLHKLKETFEAVSVQTSDGSVYGYITTLTAEALTLKRIEPNNLDASITIQSNTIQFITVRTKAVREVTIDYRRRLKRG